MTSPADELLFDVDGVWADLVGGTAKVLGIPGWVPAPQWHFLSNLPEPEQHRARALWRDPQFMLNLPEVPGARRALDHVRARLLHLAAKNRRPVPRIRAVTAVEHCLRERALWLEHRFGLPPEQVSFEVEKSHVPGLLLVEDKPENCEGWSRRQGRRAFLFSAPHNEGHPWEHRLRCWDTGLPTLLAHLDEIFEIGSP